MWKWILIAVVAVAAWSTFSGKFRDRATTQQADEQLQKIAHELNAQLPQTAGDIRVDSVAYSDHVMHYEATTLPGKELSDDAKREFQQRFRAQYCGKSQAMVKHKIGVEYTVKVSPTFADTRPKPWVTSFAPADCG